MKVFYDIVTINQYSGTSTSVDNIYQVINRYDNRFSHTSGTTVISINNIDINFENSGTYNLMIDGRVTPITSGASSETHATTYAVTIFISQTVFYFLFKTNDSTNTPVGGFCWIRDQNVNYIGVSVITVSNGAIDTMNFTNKNTNNTYYRLRRHAQFTLKEPYLLCVPMSMMADSSGNYQLLTELKSCSTLPLGMTIDIDDVKYCAIGYNTLIPR